MPDALQSFFSEASPKDMVDMVILSPLNMRFISMCGSSLKSIATKSRAADTKHKTTVSFYHKTCWVQIQAITRKQDYKLGLTILDKYLKLTIH